MTIRDRIAECLAAVVALRAELRPRERAADYYADADLAGAIQRLEAAAESLVRHETTQGGRTG